MGWAPGEKEPDIRGINGSGEASSSMALHQVQLQGVRASSFPGLSSRSRVTEAGSVQPAGVRAAGRRAGMGEDSHWKCGGGGGALFSHYLYLFLKTEIDIFIHNIGLRSDSLGQGPVALLLCDSGQ